MFTRMESVFRVGARHSDNFSLITMLFNFKFENKRREKDRFVLKRHINARTPNLFICARTTQCSYCLVLLCDCGVLCIVYRDCMPKLT